MADTVQVVIAGATGRTGREVARAIVREPDLRLLAAVGQHHAGEHLGNILGDSNVDAMIYPTVDTAARSSGIQGDKPVILVDFTEPESAFDRLMEATARGWGLVVGTTGFSRENRDRLVQAIAQRGVSAAIVANFSIGAWVSERLAEQAAQYFQHLEIIEAHQEAKRDRPSGTAKRMAELLGHQLSRDPESIPVHSIRLPGMVAHQAVVFGASGQVVTIRHDVHDRSAYAGGVIQAIRKVARFRDAGRIMEDLGEVLTSDEETTPSEH